MAVPGQGRLPEVADLTISLDVPAPMRDGVVLRANVYRPAGRGPWPTLLARTPYGKDLPGASAWLDPVRAAAAGFMVVIQDTRGRFASDGAWEPFRHEAQDGYDTVEWAAGLPGSNGRVGMFGLSYWGSTQWLAAIAQPPSLGAIAPGLTWCDPADGMSARGGALELGLGLVWALEQGIEDARRRGDSADALVDELDRLEQHGFWELPAGSSARRHGVIDLGGIRHDQVVADEARVAGRHDRVQVPVLSIGGWYDCFAQGVIDNHLALGPRAGPLVVGPWTHSNFTEGIGGLTFGVQARRDDSTTFQLDWFRKQLTPSAPENGRPAIRIFVMGANRWRDEPSWPPPGVKPTRWYLHAHGALSSVAPEEAAVCSEFLYDPGNPVPTLGGQTLIEPFVTGGPVDQRAIEAREDVLVFTSSALTEDLEVTGPVTVVLWAQSDAPSTDWVARLCDVHPDGRSFNLCDGILRVADDARDLRRHEIALWSTSNLFRRGHRLRVHVTSSSFPRWDRNLNTGDQRGPAHARARQRVYHDADRSSHIQLPVLDRG